MLYELLTLQRPFPGNAGEEILVGIMTREPKSPCKINPRIPLDFEAICLKAMEKDAGRRYVTVGVHGEQRGNFLQNAAALRGHPKALSAPLPAVRVGIIGGWHRRGNFPGDGVLRAFRRSLS